MSATVAGDRLVLSQRLTGDADKLPALAGFAAGRMLREEAVLAYGDGAAFLWQDAPADAGEQALVRLFDSESELHRAAVLVPDRIHLIAPGLIALTAILTRFGVGTVQIVRSGIRDGLIAERCGVRP